MKSRQSSNRFTARFFLGILMTGCFSLLNSQSIQQNMWVTNGRVYTTAVHNNTLYVGGAFTYAGPPTGGGGIVDATTGALRPGSPRVKGRIYGAVDDGAGGWFVGGDFTEIGGISRNGFAHIKADNSIDPNWAFGVDKLIMTMAKNKQTLYIGGQFTSVGGKPRLGLASFDIGSATLSDWNPGAGGYIFSIAPTDSVVFVGGAFFSLIGGKPRRCLAAIGASTGTALDWNPSPNSVVHAICVDGSSVIVGGEFDSLGGSYRHCLGSVSITTGLPTSWAPVISDYEGFISSIAASDSLIYVGGTCDSVNGIARKNVAAFNRKSGALSSWYPVIDKYISVNTVIATDSLVFIGGKFQIVGGLDRKNVVAVSKTTGTPSSWVTHTNSDVYTVVVSGGSVFVGGGFSSIGGVVRNYAAAFDPLSGEATSWNPNLNSTAYRFAFGDTTVYIGGFFSSVNGMPRKKLAAVGAAAGTLLPWNPGASLDVMAIAVADSVVYIGGYFDTVANQPRNHIAAVNASTGDLLPWNPGANQGVFAFARADTLLYIGGRFDNIGGIHRSGLASISLRSGAMTSWDPNPSASWISVGGPYIFAILATDSIFYLGGQYDLVAGQTRHCLAAVHPRTGALLDWNPDVNAPVECLALDGDKLYVGGDFYMVSSVIRNRLASVNARSGKLTSWTTDAVTDNIYGVSVQGSIVFAGGEKGLFAVGGDLTSVGGEASAIVPRGFEVYQNYPNPFNPNTVISYHLPAGQAGLSVNSSVMLKVFDVLGREVSTLVNERQSAGTHAVDFSGDGLSGGVYFYRLQAGSYTEVKKMLLLK